MSAARLAAAGLCAAAIAIAAAPAAAEVRRAAVIVGNNVGDVARQPLRYAESDAGRLARVLVELGRFPHDDVYLLRGRDAASLRAALGAVSQKVAAWRSAGPGVPVEILFYFSGHSDGLALELGHERFPFTEVKDWSAHTGAEVRLIILDSCKSGSLIAEKGGRPGPGFDIRMADSLASTGEAVLTSSAADELALESDEIGASFFSHNLVSGLRGAADASGDGRVTLEEAYHYAFDRTLSETSRTIYGSQHPAYSFKLSGQGDLVLTEIASPRAALEVPTGYDRVLVTGSAHEVVAEVRAGAGRRIGVLPGAYSVRAWRQRLQYQGTVTVDAGRVRVVDGRELAMLDLAPAAAKGAAPPPINGALAVVDVDEPDDSADRRPPSLTFGATALAGAAILRPGAAWGARLDVSPARPTGLVGAVSLLSGDAGGEQDVLGAVGYRFGTDRHLGRLPVRLWAGVALAGGVARTTAATTTATTVTTAAAPIAGVALPVSDRVALRLDAEWAVHLAVRDSEAIVVNAPRAGLGIQLGF